MKQGSISGTGKALSVFLVCCLVTISFGVAGCGDGGSKSPQISLAENMNGKIVEEFQPVILSANATDEKDGILKSDSLVWTSDIDGELGTGEAVTLNDLSTGMHTITVTATDSDGNARTETFTITIEPATGLVVRGHGYLGRDFDYGDPYFAEFVVRDDGANDITGLELDDFTVTSSIIDLNGTVITGPEPIDIVAQIEDEYANGGFWEHSVSDAKMDIVFLIEQRGTMHDAMPDIKAQFYQFVDRLIASNVDFRIAGAGFDCGPGVGDVAGFHGVDNLDTLEEDFHHLFISGGTWWSPTSSYDALLWTPWLGFREDAEKVVVIIADIPPQTIYGTFWYAPNCGAATASAVEVFLGNHPDMTVYYCLNPGEDTDFDSYSKDYINPMAGNDLNEDGLGSGFGALESKGLITGLRSAPGRDAWPFDQSLIPLPSGPVTDSKYYLTWEPVFTWDDVPDAWTGDRRPTAAKHRVQTTIVATIDIGETLTARYVDPLMRDTTTLTMNLYDEEGNNLYDNVWSFLYYPVGDRMFRYKWQLYNRDGPVVEDIFPGTYFMYTDSGGHSFGYEDLRAIDRRWIEVPPDGLTIDITVPTAEKKFDLALARGLVTDLGTNWRQPGDPFREFAAEANAWIDSLEAVGLTWQEQIKLRRFTVALSGYANMTEYAQMEIEGAVKNVEDIIEDFQAIITHVFDLEESTSFGWDDALGIILEAAYDILTQGEFTLNKIAIEEGLEALIKYAGGALLEDLKDLVCDELADNDYNGLLCTLVNVAADLPKATEDGDWSIILEPLKELAFNIALDEVRDLVADNFVDLVFADLDLSDPLQNDLKGFVKDVLEAITSSEGFENFDETLSSFVSSVVQHAGEQYYAENRTDIVAAVNDLFEDIKSAADEQLVGMEGAGFVRDFLIGMAQDMALAALPEVKDDGSIDTKLNPDILAKVLIKHTLHHLFLKNYFIDDVNDGLNQALLMARNYVPAGEDRSDWTRAMSRDFFDYREAVDDLQNVAWDALEAQDDINDWASALDALVAILKPLAVALDFMATFYPPLEETANEVDNFVAVLDGVQVISTAIEFALRVDSLDTFGDRSEDLYLFAFGEHEE